MDFQFFEIQFFEKTMKNMKNKRFVGRSRGLHGKFMENPKKKEAIWSKNEDFGKFSKFLEIQQKKMSKY